MTPPRPLPDPRRWPHPITALRRWARRWLGVDQLPAWQRGHLRRHETERALRERHNEHLAETFEHIAKRLDRLDAEVARLKGTTGAIGDRYPVALHDGRCLRRCCADLSDDAFADAFRRVTGEGEG